MTDKEAQPCNKCGCPVVWDPLFNPPPESNRAKDGKKGWWKEDLTKNIHTLDRCKNFQKTKEFLDQAKTSSDGHKVTAENAVEQDPRPTTTRQAPIKERPDGVKELDISKLDNKGLTEEAKVHCKTVLIVEQVIIDELTEVTEYTPQITKTRPPTEERVNAWLPIIYDLLKKSGKV